MSTIHINTDPDPTKGMTAVIEIIIYRKTYTRLPPNWL
jgi:hypothetical protein